jgi:type IV pilus assembly protein PilN
MIRINLLTRKKSRVDRQEKTQTWLLVAFGLVLLEIVALVIYHGFKLEDLKVQERKNSELSAQIDQSKKAVAKHAEVKEKLAQLRAREEAIAKLQSARSGPTSILLELSRLLTPGRGPTVDAGKLSQLRRDDPAAAFNANWDARRLWILNFKEDKRKLRIEGLARDGEDVSELARRMSLSDYFVGVKLLPARRQVDQATKVELVRFSLEAGVKY